MALTIKDLQENSATFEQNSATFEQNSATFEQNSATFERYFFQNLRIFVTVWFFGENFLLFLRRLRYFDNILPRFVGGSDVE